MTTLRSAIYTRKSSEEGLEQEFNSLEAQREACEAYIQSQTHEGWKAIPKRYDDGGYSGGTLERPGLQQLLEDIRDGQINVVVVYKVDRLTRSLTDFAKIVEVFDAAGVSFVAVTQHFNTTTSMGRLTLNVLLSFAQFEREVTGERIRDKIAASKKKGMWMGGAPPLGYDLRDRKLHVNRAEAEHVHFIYTRYRELKDVSLVREELRRLNIRSKCWTSRRGVRHGGNHFARGALYRILRNRLYLGQIEHRGHLYPAEHDAIVSQDLWGAVQEILDRGRRRGAASVETESSYLLHGLLFDDTGNAMLGTYTQKRKNKRYHYYVSAPLLGHGDKPVGSVSRIPARAIEELVCDRVRTILGVQQDETLAGRDIRAAVERIVLAQTCVHLTIHTSNRRVCLDQLQAATDSIQRRNGHAEIRINIRLKKRGGERIIVDPDGRSVLTDNCPDPKLVRSLAQAYAWRDALETGAHGSIYAVARSAGCDPRYVRKLLRLAYLAPDIMEAILDGRQPASLELQHLTDRRLPRDWASQRSRLGFGQQELFASRE